MVVLKWGFFFIRVMMDNLKGEVKLRFIWYRLVDCLELKRISLVVFFYIYLLRLELVDLFNF